METFLQDLRYAVRRLAKSPGFALIAILTLALGIGANSAIFTVVNAVLLRPLPYPEADRLVRVFHLSRDGEREVMSPGNFRSVREQARSLEELSFFQYTGPTLTGVGDPVRLDGASVGQRFFEVMGVQPALGRTFRDDENQPGNHRVAVLSHGTWQQRFGGDAGVVGRTISLYGEPYEVVGVMPRGFDYPGERELWIPTRYDEQFLSEQSRGAWYISGIGKLAPGATAERAAEEIATIAGRLEQEYPQFNTGLGMTAASLYEVVVGDVRTPLLVLLGAVGLVLLIACANVANLLLARAAARENELAVRTALGAGSGRLTRQLLTESVLLGVLGGAAGLLLAVWGTSLLVMLQPEVLPRLADLRVDGAVVAFTLGISLLAGLLFGLVPAWQVRRANLSSTIREGGRGALTGRSGNRVRSTLVVAEVALSMVLLAGAGLLINSFLRLQGVDPGFRPEGVVTFSVSLPQAAYGEDEQIRLLTEGLVERLRALPGATSAASVSDLPMGGSAIVLTFNVQGRPPAQPGEEPVAQILRATPDYFQTMGIPVTRGRGITPDDRAGGSPVVVINEEHARQLFPGEDPVGQRILLGLGPDTVTTAWEVVGVVGNTRQFGLDSELMPVMYFSQAQAPARRLNLVVRTEVPPMSLAGGIRRELEALDPNLPVNDLRAVEAVISESVSQPRFYMLLLGIFAAVALTLAAIGIFGVISYAVTQRTREIGVRMALGADPRSILKLVVGGALGLAGLGVGIGLVGALAGTRLLSNLLFGVGATDPLTFAAVAGVLLGVAFVASYLPARAATRVDPNVAIRYE